MSLLDSAVTEKRFLTAPDGVAAAFAKAKADAVVLCNCLHEIEPRHWPEVFAQIAACLSDEGVLIMVEDLEIPVGELALVMAIHGPWGSGKSTLLNFAKHYLTQDSSDEIVTIDFNPWWFNDKDHLATQFLSQFKSQLPHESEMLRGLGDLMAEYSGALGKVVAIGYGHPWLDKPIGFLLKLFKRKDKDVPKLKSEISAALLKAKQRFLFVIDDIDRLTPDEVRELFKVIKALADFPNVIYLLSFDRDVVAQSLSTSLKVDGGAYLEKIVQVPFSLPAIDPLRLRQKFIDELNVLFGQFPPKNFDQGYWTEVFSEGLEQFIDKPRSVVRIINVLSVTYPAVAGEVNPIDFIALEFLRVFEPFIYSTICTNKAMFTGKLIDTEDAARKRMRSFHDSWLEKVQDVGLGDELGFGDAIIQHPTATRTFSLKADARAWASIIESEMERGIFVDRTKAEKTTFGDLLGRYLQEVSSGKKGSEPERYRINSLLRDPLAQYSVTALTGEIMSRWRDQRLKEVTGSTANRELNLISHVMNVARREWGIHVENPVAMIRRPPENRSRIRRLGASEEARLMHELEASARSESGCFEKGGTRNPWIYPLVVLALETAMRRSELLSLRWNDCFLPDRFVRLADTKNGESRDVPLSRRAYQLLADLPRHDSGRVFPISPDAVKKAFVRAVERAGIHDLRFHDLRHESTSRIAEKLSNVLELSAVTGHKSISMLRRYYHPRATDLARKLG